MRHSKPAEASRWSDLDETSMIFNKLDVAKKVDQGIKEPPSVKRLTIPVKGCP
jgi:hypothetical protein